MIEDLGNIAITECDHANIPVSCFLCKPENDDEHPGKWSWTAANYMPRKGYVMEDGYKLIADTKEELLGLVHKHVVPLYVVALEQIKTGTLYYWDNGK
jgi:hypothetical protein